jgi:hypothetical protein
LRELAGNCYSVSSGHQAANEKPRNDFLRARCGALFPNPLRKETSMDSTTELESSQIKLSASTQYEVGVLCELVQYLRAWWDAFQSSIQQVDQVASLKAHDALAEAVILARRIARQLGVVLPDFLNVDWSASVPPAGHAATTEI